MLFFRFRKVPAGTLLLRNVIFQIQKSPCGHVTAQKCYFSGSKKPLRARYCSEMLFFGFKKAPAGTLLLRHVIFQVQKSPCGHVTAQKYYFYVKKEPLRSVFFLEKRRKSDVLGYWASRIFKSRVFLDGRQLTRTARPGPVFPVHRKPLRRWGSGAGLA